GGHHGRDGHDHPGHHHTGHHEDHHHHHHIGGSIGVAFGLNLFFAVVELVGGILTNSVAILSDAVHDLGDAATLGISWYLETLSTGKRTGRLTYGFRRYSLLGALMNGIILLVGSLVIIIEAVPRLLTPERVEPVGMIGLALLGLLINGVAVLRLRKEESTNSRMVMLHLFEDLLGWAAVLVGSILILFFGFLWLDPILSLGVTLFILIKATPRLLEAGRLFMQYAPPQIDLDKLAEQMESHPEISAVHDLHIWSLDGRYTLLTAHTVLSHQSASITLERVDQLRRELKAQLKEIGIDHATLEFEGSEAACEGCDL
ncbi:MAG: cation diffusion facilitator family transporter, partial [Alkalispirochaetaceae bacterium]